jgi:hypothetical protein
MHHCGRATTRAGSATRSRTPSWRARPRRSSATPRSGRRPRASASAPRSSALHRARVRVQCRPYGQATAISLALLAALAWPPAPRQSDLACPDNRAADGCPTAFCRVVVAKGFGAGAPPRGSAPNGDLFAAIGARVRAASWSCADTGSATDKAGRHQAQRRTAAGPRPGAGGPTAVYFRARRPRAALTPWKARQPGARGPARRGPS